MAIQFDLFSRKRRRRRRTRLLLLSLFILLLSRIEPSNSGELKLQTSSDITYYHLKVDEDQALPPATETSASIRLRRSSLAATESVQQDSENDAANIRRDPSQTSTPTNNTDDSQTHKWRVKSHFLLVLFALLALINLIVIFGNILVIVAVYATEKLRNVTNIFIVSLATADLMLGLFVLPYALMFEVLDTWIFGQVWCRGWLVTDVWISTASILNLCAISIDRYVAVTRPVKYRSIMTAKRAKCIVALVWLVSFLICFPPLLPEWSPPASSLNAVGVPSSSSSLQATLLEQEELLARLADTFENEQHHRKRKRTKRQLASTQQHTTAHLSSSADSDDESESSRQQISFEDEQIKSSGDELVAGGTLKSDTSDHTTTATELAAKTDDYDNKGESSVLEGRRPQNSMQAGATGRSSAFVATTTTTQNGALRTAQQATTDSKTNESDLERAQSVRTTDERSLIVVGVVVVVACVPSGSSSTATDTTIGLSPEVLNETNDKSGSGIDNDGDSDDDVDARAKSRRCCCDEPGDSFNSFDTRTMKNKKSDPFERLLLSVGRQPTSGHKRRKAHLASRKGRAELRSISLASACCQWQCLGSHKHNKKEEPDLGRAASSQLSCRRLFVGVACRRHCCGCDSSSTQQTGFLSLAFVGVSNIENIKTHRNYKTGDHHHDRKPTTAQQPQNNNGTTKAYNSASEFAASVEQQSQHNNDNITVCCCDAFQQGCIPRSIQIQIRLNATAHYARLSQQAVDSLGTGNDRNSSQAKHNSLVRIKCCSSLNGSFERASNKQPAKRVASSGAANHFKHKAPIRFNALDIEGCCCCFEGAAMQRKKIELLTQTGQQANSSRLEPETFKIEAFDVVALLECNTTTATVSLNGNNFTAPQRLSLDAQNSIRTSHSNVAAFEPPLVLQIRLNDLVKDRKSQTEVAADKKKKKRAVCNNVATMLLSLLLKQLRCRSSAKVRLKIEEEPLSLLLPSPPLQLLRQWQSQARESSPLTCDCSSSLSAVAVSSCNKNIRAPVRISDKLPQTSLEKELGAGSGSGSGKTASFRRARIDYANAFAPTHSATPTRADPKQLGPPCERPNPSTTAGYSKPDEHRDTISNRPLNDTRKQYHHMQPIVRHTRAAADNKPEVDRSQQLASYARTDASAHKNERRATLLLPSLRSSAVSLEPQEEVGSGHDSLSNDALTNRFGDVLLRPTLEHRLVERDATGAVRTQTQSRPQLAASHQKEESQLQLDSDLALDRSLHDAKQFNSPGKAAPQPTSGGRTGCTLFHDKTYVLYSSLGSFYIPMLIMIFFYSRIYLVASRAQKAMQRGYMTTKWPPISRSAASKTAAAAAQCSVNTVLQNGAPSSLLCQQQQHNRSLDLPENSAGLKQDAPAQNDGTNIDSHPMSGASLANANYATQTATTAAPKTSSNADLTLTNKPEVAASGADASAIVSATQTSSRETPDWTSSREQSGQHVMLRIHRRTQPSSGSGLHNIKSSSLSFRRANYNRSMAITESASKDQSSLDKDDAGSALMRLSRIEQRRRFQQQLSSQSQKRIQKQRQSFERSKDCASNSCTTASVDHTTTTSEKGPHSLLIESKPAASLDADGDALDVAASAAADSGQVSDYEAKQAVAETATVVGSSTAPKAQQVKSAESEVDKKKASAESRHHRHHHHHHHRSHHNHHRHHHHHSHHHHHHHHSHRCHHHRRKVVAEQEQQAGTGKQVSIDERAKGSSRHRHRCGCRSRHHRSAKTDDRHRALQTSVQITVSEYDSDIESAARRLSDGVSAAPNVERRSTLNDVAEDVALNVSNGQQRRSQSVDVPLIGDGSERTSDNKDDVIGASCVGRGSPVVGLEEQPASKSRCKEQADLMNRNSGSKTNATILADCKVGDLAVKTEADTRQLESSASPTIMVDWDDVSGKAETHLVKMAANTAGAMRRASADRFPVAPPNKLTSSSVVAIQVALGATCGATLGASAAGEYRRASGQDATSGLAQNQYKLQQQQMSAKSTGELCTNTTTAEVSSSSTTSAQMRKQSLMLLNTLTSRGGQTLRRLSAVAMHPMDTLLQRSGSSRSRQSSCNASCSTFTGDLNGAGSGSYCDQWTTSGDEADQSSFCELGTSSTMHSNHGNISTHYKSSDDPSDAQQHDRLLGYKQRSSCCDRPSRTVEQKKLSALWRKNRHSSKRKKDRYSPSSRQPSWAPSGGGSSISSSAITGQGGPKRTFDDFLMSVAGIDSSSDEDDVPSSFEDDDDDEEPDDDASDDSDLGLSGLIASAAAHRRRCSGRSSAGDKVKSKAVDYSLISAGESILIPSINIMSLASDELDSATGDAQAKLISKASDSKNVAQNDLQQAFDSDTDDKCIINSSLSIDRMADASNHSNSTVVAATAKDEIKRADPEAISNYNEDTHVEDTAKQDNDYAQDDVDNKTIAISPTGGLHRQGGYYESATSRSGECMNVNASKVDKLKEASVATVKINTTHSNGWFANQSANLLSGLVGRSNKSNVTTEIDNSYLHQQPPVRRRPKRTSRWHAKRLRAETKAAKTVGIIVGGFIFCWLPFFTVYLIRALICESPHCIPQSLLSLFIWLGYLNSAINPVIYGLFSADFRHAFKNIVCRCRFRRHPSEDTKVVSVLVDNIIKSIL